MAQLGIPDPRRQEFEARQVQVRLQHPDAEEKQQELVHAQGLRLSGRDHRKVGLLPDLDRLVGAGQASGASRAERSSEAGHHEEGRWTSGAGHWLPDQRDSRNLRRNWDSAPPRHGWPDAVGGVGQVEVLGSCRRQQVQGDVP